VLSDAVISVFISGTDSYLQFSINDITIGYQLINSRPSEPITFEDNSGKNVRSFE